VRTVLTGDVKKNQKRSLGGRCGFFGLLYQGFNAMIGAAAIRVRDIEMYLCDG